MDERALRVKPKVWTPGEIRELRRCLRLTQSGKLILTA